MSEYSTEDAASLLHVPRSIERAYMFTFVAVIPACRVCKQKEPDQEVRLFVRVAIQTYFLGPPQRALK